MTKRRKRLDQIAQDNGWTHRMKNKSRDPYLKIYKGTVARTKSGEIYIDMDEKFRWIAWEEVVEL